MIKAEIIKDSITESGARLTTFVLTYPRFIHSEFMTHRMISKNASSSRAIPTSKFLEQIEKNPAMPIAFSKNEKGMQATENIDNQDEAVKLWLQARDSMMNFASQLTALGVHKQHVNRLLEPFQHITVIATATEWSNFFALRCHKDAQPEFQELAKLMWNEYQNNTPQTLSTGQWHLPFVSKEDEYELSNLFLFKDVPGQYGSMYNELLRQLIISSVARCARVSYNNHDGTTSSFQKDIELYERLVKHNPIHASPTEHQAMALLDRQQTSGNLVGWKQFRKTLQNENVKMFSGYPNV